MAERKCFDVRYSGKSVVFIDANLRQFDEYDVTTYTCNEKISKIIEVKPEEKTRKLQLISGEWVVCNPNPGKTDGMNFTRHYGWFAIRCALEQMKISINTEWNIIPLLDLKTIPEKTSDNDVFVIPSILIDGFVEKRSRAIIVPLLETIIHVNQLFHGMSLKQISCEIHKGWKAEYYDEKRLLVGLFEFFRSEFISLCNIEGTPIQELHLCEFNNTFLYGGEFKKPSIPPEAVKRMIDVYMVPQSLLVGLKRETYGNIPWKIRLNDEEKDIAGEKVYSVDPFLFFKTNTHGKKAQHLNDVIIFPRMTIDGVHYAAGSSMAFRSISETSKGSELILRGSLFDSISCMERIVLGNMYAALYDDVLEASCDPIIVNRNIPLPPSESFVRVNFIKAIKEAMLSVQNSYIKRPMQ